MRYVVIMAGGSGTRLWPLSRQGTPKQLLEIFGGRSLLRLAYERVAGMFPDAQILTCTSRAYADVVASQLPELPLENILGEPVGRDSLNAVAWSAGVLADRDPDAVVAMVTADQVIEPIDEFQRSLARAFDVVEAHPDALVTLGVVPTSAHTGYGYLHRAEELDDFEGVHALAEFKEKPALEVAERYLASGEYWWNAGMFVWRAQTLLDQLAILVPDTAAKIARIVEDPTTLDAVFPTLEKTSVDYAIMEPVSAGRTDARVVSVGLDVDWRDVGGYLSLAEQFSRDADGNAVEGLAMALDSQGCILINMADDNHLVAGLGLRDTLVVHTDTSTLVAPLHATERVKELVDLVRTTHGAEFA
ncbi:mannose-1-phosphate guanylyltransferase [Tessaracoccus antarcticus]|uniref:Mannose-1-phosphate guanylyltransferase n=1 Tax=Tessaracoccus antarcticus TaxID=2479848 RepID=A0A3M0GB83_9ACTN|nr:mannose-1-phosphate guanylyltransferase [Tessaracoccus antarcticus]RMB62275.1 mannose-1-phosphate guanylyltransferase [Tessaracoccus antarcticus]